MTPEQEHRRQLIMAEIGALLLPIAHFVGEVQIILASGVLGLLQIIQDAFGGMVRHD